MYDLFCCRRALAGKTLATDALCGSSNCGLSAARIRLIVMRVSLRTKIRRMNEENTKRIPMSGRLRLVFKCSLLLLWLVRLLSQILTVSHTACDHRSSRHLIILYANFEKCKSHAIHLINNLQFCNYLNEAI